MRLVRVGDDIDTGRLARGEGALDGGANLGGGGHELGMGAEAFGHEVVTGRAKFSADDAVGAVPGPLAVANHAPALVVVDDDDDRDLVADGGVKLSDVQAG